MGIFTFGHVTVRTPTFSEEPGRGLTMQGLGSGPIALPSFQRRFGTDQLTGVDLANTTGVIVGCT